MTTATLLSLIPALPLFAAAVAAVTPRTARKVASGAALAAMAAAFALSCIALHTALAGGTTAVQTANFDWLSTGTFNVQLGLLLDPLAALMLVMVTFVSFLIFLFSTAYMRDDPRYPKFFCYLSLFAAAMLGIVVSNSLLLTFIAWELVGLASYLLIGFWFEKPTAAAAAKKAFITTRVGDLGFLLGLVWLDHAAGTLLFYNNGAGFLETAPLGTLTVLVPGGLMLASTAIGLLIFAGAVGKSGQFPLHVWLPDAMEGPTPVSALIHAATMVAAGVFLMVRIFPLLDVEGVLPKDPDALRAFAEMATRGMEPDAAGKALEALVATSAPDGGGGASSGGIGVASGAASHFAPANFAGFPFSVLDVVAFIGAITALLGAVIAVAQNDIKRVLAFSTVSQLGYMMLSIGVGAPAAAMFHLLTHAFFKALLFLGAGSVIHAAHHEQDMRNMGGLGPRMKTTFATFAVGMMALSGVPFLFSGFWSKEGILHGAHEWSVSQIPFAIALVAVVLTAFYMTRLMVNVFAGTPRSDAAGHARENTWTITLPLVLLAVCAVLVGFLGTPAWPWLQTKLSSTTAVASASSAVSSASAVSAVPSATASAAAESVVSAASAASAVPFEFGKIFEGTGLMVFSIVLVALGIGAGWAIYGVRKRQTTTELDPLERRFPRIWRALENRLYFDEFYAATLFKLNAALAVFADILDRRIVDGLVRFVAKFGKLLGFLNQDFDEGALNAGFNTGAERLRGLGAAYSASQSGEAHGYLRILATAFVVVALAALILAQITGA